MPRTCAECGVEKAETEFATVRLCRECHRAKRRARYARPEINARIKSQQAGYRATPEAKRKRHAINAAYWRRNKAADQARRQERRERKRSSPEYIAAQEARKRRTAENFRLHRRVMQARRRERLKRSGRHFTREEVEEIYAMQRKRCAICRAPLRRKFEIDHIVPVVLGGSNGRDNIQLTCKACNRHKRAKDPLVFMRELGRLL